MTTLPNPATDNSAANIATNKPHVEALKAADTQPETSRLAMQHLGKRGLAMAGFAPFTPPG